MFLDSPGGVSPALAPTTAPIARTGRSIRFGVDSEYGRLTSVLLAEPDELELVACNSVSNESLRDGLSPCQARARRQHAALVSALEDEGVEVRLVGARRDLPDLAFTRDTSLMTPWGLLGLAPGAPHRRREVQSVLAAAADENIPVLGRIERGRVEGGDIALIRPGVVAIGISGERTDETGAAELGAIFRRNGWRVLTCRFDPHFLHLDTQFCMVDRNLALACTDVLDEGFIDAVTALGIELLPVSYKEVRRLGCNLLSLGERRVVTAGSCSRVDLDLAARGYRVIGVELSEFTMCGGGVHCLTMPLARAAG